MLCLGLFIASSTKQLFGNPDWYMEWLGMADRRYPAWLSDLRTLPPSFCGTPPPPPPPMGCDRVWKCIVEEVKWYTVPKNVCFYYWFFSKCSDTQPLGRFCLDLDGHSILWIGAHGHEIITLKGSRRFLIRKFSMKFSSQDENPFPVVFCLTAVTANPGGFLLFFCFWICKEHRPKQRNTLEVSYVYS